MSRVPRTEKIVVGTDLNGHVGKILVFFNECIEEKAMAKETEKGRSWKAEPRLGTSKHFILQQNRKSI